MPGGLVLVAGAIIYGPHALSALKWIWSEITPLTSVTYLAAVLLLWQAEGKRWSRGQAFHLM